MDEEPVNHPLCRCFFLICGAPLILAGAVLGYSAIDEHLRFDGKEGVWIMVPTEYLAIAGGGMFLTGLMALYLVFRRKSSWPVDPAQDAP